MAARKAPLSLGFHRPEYWSGLPCPSPGDLPDEKFKPGSPVLQADSLLSEPPGKPREYWSGPPCPPPGDLPDPGIETKPLMSPALAGGFFTTSITWEARC